MASQHPDVTLFGHRRILKLGLYIKVVILDLVLDGILEQVIYLGRLESGERHIEVCSLQVGDKQGKDN
jgi:hypothetical protein